MVPPAFLCRLNDLIKFAQWILGITENDLLQRSTIDSLFKDWTTHHLGRSLGWDLRISPDQTPWIYHTGYTGIVHFTKQGAARRTDRLDEPGSSNRG